MPFSLGRSNVGFSCSFAFVTSIGQQFRFQRHQRYQFFHRPNMIGQPRLYRWSDAQRLMHTTEVVICNDLRFSTPFWIFPRLFHLQEFISVPRPTLATFDELGKLVLCEFKANR